MMLFFSCNKENDNQEYTTQIDELMNSYKRENPLPNIELLGINCDDVNGILTEIFNADQEIRNNGNGSFVEIDRQNLQKFVSMVESCGFPSKKDILTENAKEGIFLVLQHAPATYKAHYYKNFKNLVDLGVVEKARLAYYQDKFLLWIKYPQIYGTQIQNGHLYPVVNPDKINERRNKMGLGRIEEYVKRYSLNFDQEVRLFAKDTLFDSAK
ncbi:DUF6624 domain-containing protein [Aquimarina spongiae]|uniref:Uncharacterized protein n=1 Tax=Aquimarina spongiae TaxID=570521 RepID=A0A1M6DD22_9FLAO|nr:DUF6624 domain-containing protein [Aquimarina spongiae]SHI71184.1 hypothetical protein SAMN04488508_102556 [Aquimarina spongiae]